MNIENSLSRVILNERSEVKNLPCAMTKILLPPKHGGVRMTWHNIADITLIQIRTLPKMDAWGEMISASKQRLRSYRRGVY